MEERPSLPDVLPARHPGLEVAEFEAEFVVYDAQCNLVHRLVDIAAVVFDACDGETSTGQLVAEFAEEMGLDGDAARQLVGDTLTELGHIGALVGTGDGRRPP